jgi:hypothetical protein
MIALYITAGWVTGDPRYGDPATRLADIAVQRFGPADDAVKSDLQWVDKVRQRRAQKDAWWRPAINQTTYPAASRDDHQPFSRRLG